MIHNLTPVEDQVWITYDIDFIPATAPQAQGIKEAKPAWLDVQNGSVYPVFDALKGRVRTACSRTRTTTRTPTRAASRSTSGWFRTTWS